MEPRLETTHDDLALLSLIIEAGGFTRAAAVSGMTKSRLSRRLAELEHRLAVRLIDRNARRFDPTPIGLELAQRGAAIRAEGQMALQIARESLRMPRGALRVACPAILATQVVARFSVAFSQRYPEVSLTFDVSDGTKAPSFEGYDIILSAAIERLPDSEAIARKVLVTRYELVATPDWIARQPDLRHPADLSGLSGIGWWDGGQLTRFRLFNDKGEVEEFPIHPRLTTNNLVVALEGARAGLGMARLPERMCAAELRDGGLVHVLKGWRPLDVSIYALYMTRLSLMLAGRVYIEELAQYLYLHRARPLA
ncbi:MAG: LysR substrate-binding domain-containing protein [Roseinatronobacter sp.]